MELNKGLGEIVEYRGIEGLVAARVLVDDNESSEGHGLVYGEIFSVAGIAELSRTTDSSSTAKYYDNIPAIVINSISADTVTLSVSAIPLDVLAEITGQYYDAATGMLVEGAGSAPYFAIGYKTKKTNGAEVYVWRFKGQFGIPDSQHQTENDGTDSNGQSLTFTGISTTHKFAKTGKGAKAINVDSSLNRAELDDFFDAVTTPDTIVAKTDYTLSITAASGTTITVLRRGLPITAADKVHEGDVLTISCTGGTLTVNSNPFVSGGTFTVGDEAVTIASAASGT